MEALRYAGNRLDETVIRAPYDAVVTKRLVDPGEPVTSTPITYLLEIQEIEMLNLDFSLPQEMISQVSTGMPVEFDVEGVEEGRGTGKISVIYPDLDKETRSFRYRAVVENRGLKFRPGSLVQVRLVIRESKDTLIIPRKALSQKEEGWQVLVFNNNHPVPRIVRVGLVTENEAEILEGLKEDERILIPAM